MRDLSEIRKDIDTIDNNLLDLFMQRMALADDVAEYKIAHKRNVYDKQREKEKIEKLVEDIPDTFLREGVTELFEQIMSTSRKKQYRILAGYGMLPDIDFTCVNQYDFSNKTIVYQGVQGAYSQAATNAFFNENNTCYTVKTWREAMEDIISKKADYAVLPIENSSAGAVTEIYDLLAEYDVAIIGEQIIKIEHALLTLPDAKMSDIKKIYSHPQALMQCKEYLRKTFPNAEIFEMKNTAMSAQKVKEDKDISCAAIAGEINAKLYGLNILDYAIQDEKDNETRFMILSAKKTYLKDANKISMSFELPNESGSLYHSLSHIIFNGLNLSRIESRPIKGKQWEYRFFIDMDGNLSQDAVVNALRGLNEEAKEVKILGNY